VEPAEQFVRELQARGYDEMALAYLDRLEKSQIAPPEYRELLDFHRGEVLVKAALNQRNLTSKQALLDQAQMMFDRFVSQHPDHASALTANAQLGSIQIERARILLTQATLSSTAPERRETLREESRRLFAQAAKTFDQNKAQLRSRLEALPKTISPEEEPDKFAEREQFRRDYVQAQVVTAMLLYEQAQSYDTDSPQRRDLLVKAEQGFAAIAEKYRSRLGGLSALLFQGRCQQQLGEHRKALAIFEDLLSLPEGEPELRPLVIRALRGAMECWLTPEINQLEAARQQAENWLAKQRSDERSDNDWLAVRYLLADTYQRLAASDDAGRDKASWLREARSLAIDVAKYRSEWQDAAQELLSRLGHVTQPVAATTTAVATFAEGLAAAQEALSQRQVAAQTAALLDQRLSESAAGNNREELTRLLEDARGQMQQAETSALEYLRQTQTMITDETPIEQVNQIRYYLCTLYYYREDFFSAAVLAEFLSARFPSTEEGRRAAAVALASLIRLYGDGKRPSAAALRQRMTRSAERIAAQWKGQPEADDALATLVSLAVADGQTDQAMAYLQQMSPDSPKRASAELAAGQSLWNEANRRFADGAAADDVAPQQQQAVDLMGHGLQHLGSGAPNQSTVTAALLVAQHQLNHNQPAAALALLEHATFGPKTLADRGHPLLQAPDVQQRVYMLTILACVGTLPDADPPQPVLDKALAILEQLKRLGAAAGESERQMATAYVLLARSLQSQIEAAPPARRTALTGAFQQFLDRAAGSTKELSVLTWVAESYVNLGKTMVDPTGRPTAQAAPFFEKAVTTYRNILARSDRGEVTMTVPDRLMMESRLAAAYREQADYAAAIDLFAHVLERENNQVFIQLEAARTLQSWGDGGQPQAYLKAILGDRPDPKTNRNVIWGFGRIAKAVAGKEQLGDVFYEARLRIAECRFQYGLQQSAASRKDTLQQAERDIVMTAKLYPALGGAARKKEFQELLKQIQQTLGKRPTELP
jgi:hypothetical protein